MTLREALKSADLQKVYHLINIKYNMMVGITPALSQTISCYKPVVEELLSKPKARKYHMPILVQESVDYEGIKFADVCLLNPKYVKPPKGFKPWGGSKNIPPKHYNCNLAKYNSTFALGFTPWSKLIDTPIINKAEYLLEKVVAEILWEFTFYGWSENKCKKEIDKIKKSIEQSEKEIKTGKYREILPSTPNGLKVVIPESVINQINNILDKYEKKCNTCRGFGLWAIGDHIPMGKLDASDGMPTIACPECGANVNP